MKVLSLFSGIGAFEKALSNIDIDFELVNYCECDPIPSKAYSLIHNESRDKNLGDITKVNILDLGYYDLIVHGSPCQDFSIAGKHKGGEENTGTRSSLMWYSVKIIEKVKPKYIIWENVPQAIRSNNLYNFRKYLNKLIQFGYTSYYQVLNSLDYNLPQNRKRVYCVSIRNDVNFPYEFPLIMKLEKRLSDYLETDVDEYYYNICPSMLKAVEIGKVKIIDNFCYSITTKMQRWNNPGLIKVYQATKKGYDYAYPGDCINLAYSNSKTRRGRVGKQYCQTITCNNNLTVVDDDYRLRYLTPLECLRLQGFDDKDYEVLVKNGFKRDQLYKLAGNSIPVSVLEKLFYKLFIDRSTYQLSMYEFI
ncbi:DNA (cytosine-5-)-methyltransferase [Mycoplasmatota bacterium]|nr:DNA (cytosine-5-)-methyltransferase [Mycoplasmatota bacterium]